MSQHLRFSKYHGCGNDFIIIDGISQRIDMTTIKEKAKSICDRHYGIGADGIILVTESIENDFKMIIFNSDGSEPKMCGNGVRCLAHFVHDRDLFSADMFSLETHSGVKLPGLIKKEGQVVAVEVDVCTPHSSSHFQKNFYLNYLTLRAHQIMD